MTDGRFAALVASVERPDAGAQRAAFELQDRLTKPAGSLGRLETIGAQLAAIARCRPASRPGHQK